MVTLCCPGERCCNADTSNLIVCFRRSGVIGKSNKSRLIELVLGGRTSKIVALFPGLEIPTSTNQSPSIQYVFAVELLTVTSIETPLLLELEHDNTKNETVIN